MDWLFPTALGLGLLSILTLLVSPAAGMVLVFIAKPFIDASWSTPLLFDLRLTETYSTLVTITLLAYMVLGRDDKSVARMPFKWLWLAYSAYIVMFSMIIAYSDELKSSANIFFRYINGIVGFYFLQAFFRQSDRFKWFLWALILGGLFPMGIGAYQAVTGVQWREAQVEGLVRTIGIWHDGVNMRVYAEQTILGLLLYSALYIKSASVSLKAVAMAYLALSTLVMVRVYSKAALLTCALWLLCWTILRRQFMVLAVLGIGGLLVTTYYAGDLTNQIGTLFHKEVGYLSGQVEGKATFQGRWFGWVEMMERWERFPKMSKIFGSGQIAIGAHNDFLQMLFHGGIVGVGMYISLLVFIGIRVCRNVLAKADEIAVAALMAYLMWVIDAIGLVPSAYPSEQWLIWGLVGMSFRMRADEALVQPEENVTRDRQ